MFRAREPRRSVIRRAAEEEAAGTRRDNGIPRPEGAEVAAPISKEVSCDVLCRRQRKAFPPFATTGASAAPARPR